MDAAWLGAVADAAADAVVGTLVLAGDAPLGVNR